MKKMWAIILLIALFIFMFVIQITILNKIKLFGVNSNLLLVTVIMISLWYNTYVSNIFAFFTGITADMFFSFGIGKSVIIYLVISVVIAIVSKVYKKDNNMVIIYIITMGVLIFETAMAIVNLSAGLNNISLWQFVILVIKSVILNIGLAYIIRKILQRYTVQISKSLDMYIER